MVVWLELKNIKKYIIVKLLSRLKVETKIYGFRFNPWPMPAIFHPWIVKQSTRYPHSEL